MDADTFYVSLVDTEDGPIARLEREGRAVDLPADDVMLVGGQLRIALPLEFEAPVGSVVVVRHLPPTRAELREAIEALDPVAVEALLVDEQDQYPGTPWGAMVLHALSQAMRMEVPDGG